MGRGNYQGGSTIIRPGSDWFSEADAKPLVNAPKTASDIASDAKQSADRAEIRRRKVEAFINAPDGGKRNALKRLKRRKRKLGA